MNTKEEFIKTGFLDLLQKLNANDKGLWGVMNTQEMVEHMSYSFRQASGKDKYDLVTAPENVERMQAFVISDREFKPGTKNVLLPEVAIPAQKNTLQESINELREEINYFFNYFKSHPDATLMNPFFGELNYEMWIALLYKHCLHHAKQFELVK